MADANFPWLRWSIVSLTLVVVAGLGIQARGQEAAQFPPRGRAIEEQQGIVRGSGEVQLPPHGRVIQDWSTHHLVFPNPGTEQDARKRGHYSEWLKIVNEPRFQMQQQKRHKTPHLLAPQRKRKHETALHRDWAMSLDFNIVGQYGGKSGAMVRNSYPAKFSFDTTATPSCTADFVVFNTGLVSSPGSPQATVMGFSNLYTGTCAGYIPSVAFSYDTGGVAQLSPVLSYDGKQIAYVQSTYDASGAGTASLVLLKPSFTSGGDVGTPATIAEVTPAQYASNCNGKGPPCYTTITFGSGADDSNSSPYYLYDGTDTLYVGDDSGYLHKFTNVFSGTSANPPAETLVANVWPAPVDTGANSAKLSGPVFEPVSGAVFVGDSNGVMSYVTPAGVVTSSAVLALPSDQGEPWVITGFADAPLIDEEPTVPVVYGFVGDSQISGSAEAAVMQFPTNFASGYSPLTSPGGTYALLSGSGGSGWDVTMYAGTFDNLYYATGGKGGNMWVCGIVDGTNGRELYRLPMPMVSGQAVSDSALQLSDSSDVCTPVTEFLGSTANTTLSAALAVTGNSVRVASTTGMNAGDYLQIDSEIMSINTNGINGNTLTVTRGALGTTAATHGQNETVQDIQDWIYLSVVGDGRDLIENGGPCADQCIYSFTVTTGTDPAYATAELWENGGTSGIIVDNDSTLPGASQIYFTTQGESTCQGSTDSAGDTDGVGAGTLGCAVQASQSDLSGSGTS